MRRNSRKLLSLGRNKIYCVSGIRIITWNGSQSFENKSKILGKVPERKSCAFTQRKSWRTFSGHLLVLKTLNYVVLCKARVDGRVLHNLPIDRYEWMGCVSGLGASEHLWEGHIWGLWMCKVCWKWSSLLIIGNVCVYVSVCLSVCLLHNSKIIKPSSLKLCMHTKKTPRKC